MIKGDKVTLVPLTSEELPLFYKWAAHSDVTRWWYGRLYGDKVPSYEKFVKSWGPYCYKGRDKKSGRCFSIRVDGKPIGMVNYGRIDSLKKRTSLDVIIGSEKHCGKGYGSDALKTISSYLFKKYNLKEIIISAHKNNKRAINAYKKAGFKPLKRTQEMNSDPFIIEYSGKLKPKDSVLFSMKSK